MWGFVCGCLGSTRTVTPKSGHVTHQTGLVELVALFLKPVALALQDGTYCVPESQHGEQLISCGESRVRQQTCAQARAQTRLASSAHHWRV